MRLTSKARAAVWSGVASDPRSVDRFWMPLVGFHAGREQFDVACIFHIRIRRVAAGVGGTSGNTELRRQAHLFLLRTIQADDQNRQANQYKDQGMPRFCYRPFPLPVVAGGRLELVLSARMAAHAPGNL